MPDLPVISIITVTFNDRENLRKTLESVAGQDYPAIEHVIVDGGSTDGTLEEIEGYHLPAKRWVSGKDKGIYDAMNKGLSMATGEYVTFLNAGDYYCDAKVLTDLFGDLDADATDVVYGDHYVFRPENPEHRYYLKAYTFNQHNLLKWGTRVVCHQAFFVRRSLAPEYNLSYRFKAELNWYFDIVGQNPALTLHYRDIPVVFYATGGMAYQHFWKNQLEYFNLLRHRFGLRTVLKYNHHKKVLFGLTFKYDGVRKFIPKKLIDMLKPKVD